MIRQRVYSHFKQILDELIENSPFFATYFQDMCSIENIHGDDEEVPNNIHINFGATRGCIVDDDYDYVVKFDVAQDAFCKSLCERELEIYTRAKTNNMENYFAECVYLGEYTKTIMFYPYINVYRHISINEYGSRFNKEFNANEKQMGEAIPITFSIPLFAYPKVKQQLRMNYKNDEISYDIAQDYPSPMTEENMGVAVQFIEEYGEEEYLRVSKFLEDEQINDLHYSNVGSLNNHFCFMDYAGFWEDFELE